VLVANRAVLIDVAIRGGLGILMWRRCEAAGCVGGEEVALSGHVIERFAVVGGIGIPQPPVARAAHVRRSVPDSAMIRRIKIVGGDFALSGGGIELIRRAVPDLGIPAHHFTDALGLIETEAVEGVVVVGLRRR